MARWLAGEELILPGIKHQGDARDNTRQGQRQGDFQECLPAIGTEIARGFQQAAVHFRQGGLDLQDHERQKVVDHANEHGGFRVEQVTVRNVQQVQDPFHWTAGRQQTDPGVGADQHVDPHRQCDGQDQAGLHFFRTAGNHIGNGISQDQADHGGLQGNGQGPPEDDEEVFVGEKPRVVGEGELEMHDGVARLDEGIKGDEQHRQKQHHEAPHQVRHDELTEPLHSLNPIFSMTWMSSGSKVRPTFFPSSTKSVVWILNSRPVVQNVTG